MIKRIPFGTTAGTSIELPKLVRPSYCLVGQQLLVAGWLLMTLVAMSVGTSKRGKPFPAISTHRMMIHIRIRKVPA